MIGSKSKSKTKIFLLLMPTAGTIAALPTKTCSSSVHTSKMAMKLSIVPDKRAYWPGDVVGLVVEVGWLHSQAFSNREHTGWTSSELLCSLLLT